MLQYLSVNAILFLLSFINYEVFGELIKKRKLLYLWCTLHQGLKDQSTFLNWCPFMCIWHLHGITLYNTAERLSVTKPIRQVLEWSVFMSQFCSLILHVAFAHLL